MIPKKPKQHHTLESTSLHYELFGDFPYNNHFLNLQKERKLQIEKSDAEMALYLYREENMNFSRAKSSRKRKMVNRFTITDFSDSRKWRDSGKMVNTGGNTFFWEGWKYKWTDVHEPVAFKRARFLI